MEYNYNKISIWKWILLYVLVGAVAYGLIYYFFFVKTGSYNSQNYQTQTQNTETKDWKTYNNDKFGFEFKYPAILFDEIFMYPLNGKTECEIVQGDAYSSISVFEGDGKGWGSMTIRVFCTIFDKSKLLKGKFAVPGEFGQINSESLESINIGNALGYQYVGHILTYKNIRNYVGLGDNTLEISFSVCGSDDKKNPMIDSVLMNKILSTFKVITSDKTFFDNVANSGDTYVHAKQILMQNEWMPIISDTTVIDPQFPEIGNCGSGKDAICNVDFQKGTYKNHLNVQSRNINGKLQWIVVGNE